MKMNCLKQQQSSAVNIVQGQVGEDELDCRLILQGTTFNDWQYEEASVTAEITWSLDFWA